MADVRLVLLAGLVLALAGCSSQPAPDAYGSAPVALGEVSPEHGGVALSPVRLTVDADTLWVCYRSMPMIEAWALDSGDGIERARSVSLQEPEPVIPTSLVVTDTSFVVTDHARGMVLEVGRGGGIVHSFGTLPDGATKLSPLSVAEHQGVLYVADISVRRVLAIGLGRSEGTRDAGELILTIPHRDADELGFPCAVYVTPDGRLLVGDAKSGAVEVFTCDGRAIYKFDPVPGLPAIAPQGFAQDTVIDPGKQDPTSADPSGVRLQGRFHIADSASGQVHVYGSLGAHVLSYPADGSLTGPSDVAVHAASRRIFVADPGSGRIMIYRYAEEGM
jgi:hypothetical protein